MATKTLKSLKGRRMRVTRLDECGAAVEGDCSWLVTDGFITVTFAPEVEAGEEFVQKNAWGDLCINDKDADLFKWVNVTVTACEIDPDVLDIIAAGNPISDATDTIGASFGTGRNLNAFAIEVWTKQAGRSCDGGSPEWGYFVVPFVLNGRVDGSIEIANAAMTMSFVGQGFEAPASWGTTPFEDNPLLTAAGFPEGDLWAQVRTTVQPPAVTAGCQALPILP